MGDDRPFRRARMSFVSNRSRQEDRVLLNFSE